MESLTRWPMENGGSERWKIVSILVVTISIVTITSCFLYYHWHQNGKKSITTTNFSKAKIDPISSSLVANDVWEERRRKGIVNSSCHKKENAKQDKPFGSRYYYAHNNTNSKGGYVDGLRMEDYTMNGPRLLSRSGSRVELEKEQKEELSDPAAAIHDQPRIDDASSSSSPLIVENDQKDSKQQHHQLSEDTTSTKSIRDITRYLWDDSGDASGIATLRIDELPGDKVDNDSITWKDANITTVSATLQGEGLLVIATNEEENVDYRLHIRKLYDRATDVRTIVKAKRLLLRIHKKKGILNFLGKSNMEPWPHPQRKDFIPPNID